MFYTKKFSDFLALFSLFVGYSLINATPSAFSASATSDSLQARKLAQQANIKLEEIEDKNATNIAGSEAEQYNYSWVVSAIQALPSNGQSREILAEDNNIQRLLKQQFNNSLEVYQIIGQLLEQGKLYSSDYDALFIIDDINLPFYQGVLIAIAQTNLVTDTKEKLTANNTCLSIAQE